MPPRPARVTRAPHSASFAAAALLAGCSAATIDPQGTVEIPEGSFLVGSTLEDQAQALDHSRRRQPITPTAMTWMRGEVEQHEVEQPGFHIMEHPVTQLDYWHYTQDTEAPEPWIDEDTWHAQGTGYAYAIVARFGWIDGHPPADRLDHPVVLVDHERARAYCRWWGARRGGEGDLPSELEWEKAARGTDGRTYPWGNTFGVDGGGRANTLESGRHDTIPVAAIPEAASPFGVLDMAGNVFEWTRTPGDGTSYVVKGGAWNSDALSARASARHARPSGTRHVAIGFRCVLRESPEKGRRRRAQR